MVKKVNTLLDRFLDVYNFVVYLLYVPVEFCGTFDVQAESVLQAFLGVLGDLSEGDEMSAVLA